MIQNTMLLSFWSRANQKPRTEDGKLEVPTASTIQSGTLYVPWSLGLSIAVLVCSLIGSIAGDLRLTDSHPLSMPEPGSHGLRVLAPTVIELTLITSKAADPGHVSGWDFVDEDFQLSAPGPDQFVVTAGAEALTVKAVGFKRRPIYAPLKTRDLRIASCLYLQLTRPLAENQPIEVKNPTAQLWPPTIQFTGTSDALRWSPAVHVNQVGYVPAFPKKAMVGYYLGSLGEMIVPSEGGFELLDVSGHVAFEGRLTRRLDRGFTYEPAPYQQVWEADFSSFKTPGEYRLRVPGLGTSFPFLIDEGVAATFARTYALGVFHQRCGFKQGFPFTRHSHDVCHARPAQVPDMTFSAVNNVLAEMTRDSAQFQIARPLKDCDSGLYPFLSRAGQEVSGGHHDAGDYSKYTINSAGLIHFLVFAADAFPGVSDLDNLGLPESGDGKSDLLQEAKWEADFLAKMQDADGGFYFLVYPRDREYENDVLPDKGDPQVVFPKNTAVTAAAVAALAEAGSSPVFQRQFPVEAARYLQKAELGWNFLQNAIAKNGKEGSYQKITHYGNEFTHDDELAWAACALYVATGKPEFHEQLKAWFDPSDPKTRRWTWWRLFEGYGCAVRTYAFAARSGRLSASALDPDYLRKCEAEIQATAADHVRFAQENAYGTSFPDPSKARRTAGWYFSSERTFDITVAYQLNPRADFLEAVISGLNYEGGCNPINLTYITGLGARRQREIVHQYAINDRRVLPPSGLPLGNIQASYQRLESYQDDLDVVTFPSDSATSATYPYYDRWCDTFNTTTEFVITDQARSMASLCFWMAQTSIKDQPWRAAQGQIQGLPAQAPADENVTATLVVPGVDLTGARIVWEARDQEPVFGNPVTFAAKSAGEQWVEVEAQLRDGRRVMAQTTFLATTSLKTPPNTLHPAPEGIAPDTVALFHLDQTLLDATGRHGSLTLAGNAKLDGSNLGWMAQREGMALQFGDLGDKATIIIPGAGLRAGSDTTAIILEAMVYVDSFLADHRDIAPIVSLYNAWDAFLEFGEDKYAGPYLRGGTQLEVIGPAMTSVLTPKQWHHLSLEINQTGYVARLNGNTVAALHSDQLANWGKSSVAKVELGNFAGWIDDVVIRSVRLGTAPDGPVPGPRESVAVPSITPGGGNYARAAAVSLRTGTPDATIRYTTDGTSPTSNSPAYTGPFSVNCTTTLRAQAFKDGMSDSAITNADFVVTTIGESGARATFVQADNATQGNWKGVYGADGYYIVSSGAKIPAYAELSAAGHMEYVWSSSTQDPRGLQKITGADRVASCWFSDTSFDLNLIFSDGKTHRVALYLLDWDRMKRVETVEIFDGSSDAILDSREVTHFEGGRYLTWDLKGRCRIRLSRSAGPNAVLAGLFFDPRLNQPNDLPVAPLLSYSAPGFIREEGRFHLRLSGEAGQQYVVEASTNLVDWTPLRTNSLTGSELDLNLQITSRDSGFYRTRTIAPSQAQYLIEASVDLIHWVPIGISVSPDVEQLTPVAPGPYPSRFYRVTSYTTRDLVYLKTQMGIQNGSAAEFLPGSNQNGR